MSNALLIAGPTASGKSAIAIELARHLDGEIVNGDAMQVYRDLRVLTARPSVQEEAAVPHHLYGVADGGEAWSAGVFARRAAEVVEEIAGRGAVPIVVGGTGLWLKALVEGLSPIPDIDPLVADEAAARLEEVGMEIFRQEVLAMDPGMAWLEPADTQRHLRAWTVARGTGRPLSDWQKVPPVPVTDMPFQCAVLTPPREDLYARCDARFGQMLAAGAIEEVRRLLDRGLPDMLPVMKAVGVPELARVIRGEQSLDAASEEAKMATRRLAKRQMTWFRGQGGDWPQFDSAESLAAYLRDTA